MIDLVKTNPVVARQAGRRQRVLLKFIQVVAQIPVAVKVYGRAAYVIKLNPVIGLMRRYVVIGVSHKLINYNCRWCRGVMI